MSGFQCPYCSMVMPINSQTRVRRYISFTENTYYTDAHGNRVPVDTCIYVDFYKCANCEEYTISANGVGEIVSGLSFQLRPKSLAKQFPDYIPEAIRNDYEEACAIVNLSPKASATLSRRCLQGMIHDFWGIKLKNLNQEITALKDNIPADLWSSIDALRQLGNIGAHMEKDTDVIVDIDPNEAESLIKLIELLMKEWYINREERKKLFSDIISTNESKQAERKKTE